MTTEHSLKQAPLAEVHHYLTRQLLVPYTPEQLDSKSVEVWITAWTEHFRQPHLDSTHNLNTGQHAQVGEWLLIEKQNVVVRDFVLAMADGTYTLREALTQCACRAAVAYRRMGERWFLAKDW